MAKKVRRVTSLDKKGAHRNRCILEVTAAAASTLLPSKRFPNRRRILIRVQPVLK